MELQKENWLVEKDHGYHFLAIPHLSGNDTCKLPQRQWEIKVWAQNKVSVQQVDHKVYICVSLSHSIYKHVYGAFKNTSVETETTE